MNAEELQKVANEFYPWDMRVKEVECRYFSDEVMITYDDSEGSLVSYKFTGCYKTQFNHVIEYDKGRPVKDMTIPQVPYFLQDVKISEKIEGSNRFLFCEINMFPLYIEILCKDAQIERTLIDSER